MHKLTFSKVLSGTKFVWTYSYDCVVVGACEKLCGKPAPVASRPLLTHSDNLKGFALSFNTKIAQKIMLPSEWIPTTNIEYDMMIALYQQRNAAK